MASGPVVANVENEVESLYRDYTSLVASIGTDFSGMTALNRSYHKHLLVAAASNLESQVKKLVPAIFLDQGTHALSVFVEKAVMARGYHGLFDWNNESAAPFFANFGDACRANFKAELKADDTLSREHKAFMRLGNQRNLVVHNDYATYAIDWTPDDVIENYRLACAFVARIRSLVLWDAERAS